MLGPMEIKSASFTSWFWHYIEARLPLEAEKYDVTILPVGVRRHWFLKKTIRYEMHGAMANITNFVAAALENGSCVRVSMPRSLSRRLGSR